MAGEAGFFERLSGSIDDFMYSQFYALGMRVGRYPRRTLALCLVGIVICCGGFGSLENEGRSDKLWVPEGTQAQTDQRRFQALFG